MATMLQTGPPMILLYLLCTMLQRFCGCCPVKEEAPAEENQEKTDAERAKEIDAFLSDKNVFTDSVIKENESRYGLVLQGMTKVKLTSTLKETNLL